MNSDDATVCTGPVETPEQRRKSEQRYLKWLRDEAKRTELLTPGAFDIPDEPGEDE